MLARFLQQSSAEAATQVGAKTTTGTPPHRGEGKGPCRCMTCTSGIKGHRRGGNVDHLTSQMHGLSTRESSRDLRPMRYETEDEGYSQDPDPMSGYPRREADDEEEESQVQNQDSWIFDVTSQVGGGEQYEEEGEEERMTTGGHGKKSLPPGEYFIGDLRQVLTRDDWMDLAGILDGDPDAAKHGGHYVLPDGTPFYFFNVYDDNVWKGAVNLTGRKEDDQFFELETKDMHMACMDVSHIDASLYEANSTSGVVVEMEEEFTPQREEGMIRFGPTVTLFMHEIGRHRYLNGDE